MSINCQSLCVPYTVVDNINSATITSYNCDLTGCGSVVSPPAFNITVIVTDVNPGIKKYNISIGPAPNFGQEPITYEYTIPSTSDPINQIVHNEEGVSIGYGPLGTEGNQPCGNPNAAITVVQLVIETNSIYPFVCNSGESPFVINDKYIINVLSCCNSTPSLQVTFERPLWFTEEVSENVDITNNCSNIKIPAINIYGQVTVNGQDIGDMIFTIYDKYQYYKKTPLSPSKKCTMEIVNNTELLLTTFHKCCPKMGSVSRGKGKTFYCKVESIWLWTQQNNPDNTIGFLINFYKRMILYGMSKYILSRILYGNFDINYLLGKYNDKFLEDLRKSRFCSFYILFEDCNSPVYGFNKYFKYGKKC